MKKFEDYISWIEKTWEQDPVAPLCVQIIKFIEEVPEQQLQMLTYSSIGKILNLEPLDTNVLKAISILVSSSHHLLELRHVYIDTNGEDYDIDNQEFREINRNGSYVHPISGEEIFDWQERVVPYFTPTQSTIKLKRNF